MITFYTPSQRAALDELREAGFAVQVFFPYECRGVDPETISRAMCVAAWDVIEELEEYPLPID
jgi:hypothetical protein